ncbi:MAG: HAMP domain-containing histidine kinase [Bacteroidaceae bacterium]|nr:HAMP domain-containing histidine kinase [Bacteroidaceae bacterium]
MWSTLSIIVIVVLVIALGVMAYLYHKKKEQCDKYKQGILVQKGYLQNMSHDIRTPMNAICGFSQILCNSQVRNMLSEEEISEYGVIIQSNTDLLSTLVDDILDISDMESGKYRLNIGVCNVNDVCRKAISTVKFRCPDKVNMYMTTDAADTYTIKSDPKRVEQVIMNFLTNAVKHTDEGEIHLHVSLTENPGMVTFSVADTGEGVAPDKAEVIFKRFEKFNTINGGTGLGLAICRMIATQLGGETKLDLNYKKQGARFVFTHPVDAELR